MLSLGSMLWKYVVKRDVEKDSVEHLVASGGGVVLKVQHL